MSETGAQPPDNRLSGSWGLSVDLGDAPEPAAMQTLYDAVWQAPEFSGPRVRLGEFQGLTRGAEGSLTVADQAGSCYTKFEQDNLGYPAGWQPPVSFQLSLFGFARGLPANPDLYAFLLQRAAAFYALLPYRMAMIGDLTCYYLNAEFLSPDWIDLHQQSVMALILPAAHPFARSHPGQALAPGLLLYDQARLQGFWSQDEPQERYQRFKQKLSRALHSPRLNLDWERPNDN